MLKHPTGDRSQANAAHLAAATPADDEQADVMGACNELRDRMTAYRHLLKVDVGILLTNSGERLRDGQPGIVVEAAQALVHGGVIVPAMHDGHVPDVDHVQRAAGTVGAVESELESGQAPP